MLDLGFSSNGVACRQARRRPDGAFRALALAATRRVDIVSLGDSNIRAGGSGWDDAISYAMSQRFAQYATHLGIVGGDTDGHLESDGTYPSGIFGATTGAPAALNPHVLPGTGNMGPYQFYSGLNVSTAANGLLLEPGHPIGVSGLLRAHYGYGTFLSGGGSFRPSWRRDNNPFSGLVEGSTVSAQTGAWGSARTSLDLPADPLRNYPLRAQWSRPQSGTDTMEPNFLLLWQRVERPDRFAGWSHNTLYGVGGQSLYDIAAWLIAQTDTSLANYFSLLRSFHISIGQNPVIVIRINSGANDRNEAAAPSLGPASSSDPDSAEAYVDNLAAIVLRIESIFSANGWALAELHWLITPTHRLSDPDDAKLVSYRDAAKAWAAARARTSVLDFNGMMTASEATAGGWYDAGGTIHLTQAGYRALAARELASGF
jgi:hypothetical protein